MVNNFSVDSIGLYINWVNSSLFIILGKRTSSTHIKPQLIKVAIFSMKF